MIDQIVVISWDIQILQDLFSTGIQRILFNIHRDHNYWFDEYNYRLSREEKSTPISLLSQKYPKSILHNSDLLILIPCELDLTPNPISDTKIITYEIELPPVGNKTSFNLLDDEEFTIP